MRLLVLLALMGSAWASHGQTVIYEGGTANPFAGSLKHLIETNGPAWFPNPTVAEPDGSVIGVGGDFSNADVVVVFTKDRIPEMLPKAIALVHRLGLPQLHLLIKQGRVVGSIDFEFNRYIKFDGNRSHCTVPFGQMVEDINGWGLSKPTGIYIEKRSVNTVLRLGGKPVDASQLLATNQVAENATIEIGSERHWYGLVLGILLLGVLFGVCFGVWFSVLREKPPKLEPEFEPEMPRSLADTQSIYERSRARSRLPLLYLLPMALIPMIGNRAWMEDMLHWVPAVVQEHPSGMMLILAFPFCGILIRALRAKKNPTPAAAKPNNAMLKVLPFMFIPMGILMGFMLVQTTAPQLFYGVPRPALQWTIRIVGYSAMPIALIAFFVFSKKNCTTLAGGDSDYDTAMEMAARAGVKVRRVQVLTDSQSINAFATLFGTVGLTQGFRDKLSLSERRSIVAHEIGHLKGRHVPWLMAFSLAIVGGLTWIQLRLQAIGPDKFGPILLVAFSPVTVILLVTFLRGPLQRRAEHAADSFALVTIGSFEEIAGALAKIHLLNAAPHTLRKLDAALSSHPSLTKRLDFLRTTANEMGWNIPEDAVQRMINSTVTEKVEEGTE